MVQLTESGIPMWGMLLDEPFQPQHNTHLHSGFGVDHLETHVYHNPKARGIYHWAGAVNEMFETWLLMTDKHTCLPQLAMSKLQRVLDRANLKYFSVARKRGTRDVDGRPPTSAGWRMRDETMGRQNNYNNWYVLFNRVDAQIRGKYEADAFASAHAWFADPKNRDANGLQKGGYDWHDHDNTDKIQAHSDRQKGALTHRELELRSLYMHVKLMDDAYERVKDEQGFRQREKKASSGGSKGLSYEEQHALWLANGGVGDNHDEL
jgi:hypothetical protein